MRQADCDCDAGDTKLVVIMMMMDRQEDCFFSSSLSSKKMCDRPVVVAETEEDIEDNERRHFLYSRIAAPATVHNCYASTSSSFQR